MKKLIFSAAVLASAFFAASCQQELLEPQAEGNTVTFEVSIPEVATKSYDAEGENVNDLVYAVYSTEAETLEAAKEGNLTFFYAVNETTGASFDTNGKSIVSLELLNDQNYLILFWAQSNDAWVSAQGSNINLLNVTYPTSMAANNEHLEAFSGVSFIKNVKGARKETVKLTRPFAQINLATTMPQAFTATLRQSDMSVVKAAASFNVAKQLASGERTVSFTAANVPVADFKTGYTYAGANYIFANGTVDVTYNIYTSHGDVNNTVSNVPVEKNYRTNILGNLLTSQAEYTVELEKEWADAGKDMVVLADGVVKNINDDYEITTAEGFAYAINNLFAEGGTFYIHPGTYNFTGLVVEPKPTKPGVILNVKANEVPVVTRSTPGFEIIGLDVAYLVSVVTEGSQAIFSNLVLPEDTKLVGTNNGVVGVSGCSNEDTDVPAELIGVNGQNGKVVNTVSMASVDEINAAIAQGLKLIELTGDMSLNEALVISKDVTLDGCGHTLTSSAGRAINVSGVDANGVTIKNLVIDCSGERAINIIQKANNVTIDNVTATAANYTVNVATSAPGAVVNIKNSTLNGLCTVNVASPGAEVTVDNSTINCNDNNTTAGEAYSALSLNRDAIGGKIIATNTVVNVTEGSDSHKGRNSAENGEVTINGSTEEVVVMVAAIIYPNNTNYHAFVSLDGAIDFAQESEGIVTLIRDITVAEPVIIEEDQTVVLDLNGKTLSNPYGYAIENYSELTITGEGNMEGLGGIRSHSGSLTINGGNYTCSSNWSTGTYNHILKAVDTEVVINGGNFDATVGGTNNAMINVSENSIIIINGGIFKNVNGVIPQFAPYMFTYEKNGKLIINDGSFYGGWRFNGETATTDIYGGDFTVSYDGQSFHANSTHVLTIYGGTFSLENGGKLDPSKHVADDYKAVKNAETGKWEVVEKTYVAQVGKKKYESLQEAFATVQDDQTITFLSDVEQADGVILTDKNITVDLNGKTFTVSEGASTNNRNFKINGSSKVTIKNGTMIAAGELTSGAYGTVRTEGEAVVNLETVKLYSYRGYGLNVKANTGTKVNIKDSEIYSQYSGGVEAAGGEIELTNVKIEQRGVYSSAAWCSVAIGVNGGGKVTVKSGDYYAAAIATDSNVAQATWVAYVMSSGGTLNIEGGTFNGVVAETASAANACGLICADRAAVVNIYDGIFNSNGAILDMRNNVGTQPNPVATLYGGNFSADPRVSGLYSSNLITVADGKAAVEGADGRWTIQ